MGTMPALTHPLTLEDRALTRNRWRQRRVAWGQSLFLVVVHATLATLAVMSWLQLDPRKLVSAARWVDLHASVLALAALLGAAWAMRRQLVADARRHAGSSHAALPIWRDVQRHRDTRLRWRFALQLTTTMLVAAALVAVHDVATAGSALDGLRWSWLAAVLALVFVPAPSHRPGTAATSLPRIARVPNWIAVFASRTLPHLPQWWWQRAGTTWMRGRAASALAIGLLVAPSEAAALIVPVVLLMLMALINALDVAHRLAGEISMLLAERPPVTHRLWRDLMPLHTLLTMLLIAPVLALLHLLGLGVPVLLVVAVVIALAAQIDLLFALVLRHRPARIGVVRLQCIVVAAALASAFAPLLLLAAVMLWALLMRRVWRDGPHA
jgi:hypothetical protein